MIKVEVYGKHLGDNTITEAFQTKEFSILLSIKEKTQKIEWIISLEEAERLKTQIENCFNSVEKLKRM